MLLPLLLRRSSAVAAAAATSLARLLPALHPTDWEHKDAICNALCNSLLDCCCSGSSSSSVLAAAVVKAVGYLGVILLQQQQQDGQLIYNVGNNSSDNTYSCPNDNAVVDRGLALACSCFGLLLSCVAGLGTAAAADAGSSDVRSVVDDVIRQLPGSYRDMVVMHDLMFNQVGCRNMNMICFPKQSSDLGLPSSSSSGCAAAVVLLYTAWLANKCHMVSFQEVSSNNTGCVLCLWLWLKGFTSSLTGRPFEPETEA